MTFAAFEGFIYEGPEYLSVFAGDGQEITTIPFPFPREDDGLRWGDYAMPRIEPCNRSDRFFISGGLFRRHPSQPYHLQGVLHQKLYRGL